MKIGSIRRLARIISNSRSFFPTQQRLVDALLPIEEDGRCTGMAFAAIKDGEIVRSARGCPRSGWYVYDWSQACAAIGSDRVAALLSPQNARRIAQRLIKDAAQWANKYADDPRGVPDFVGYMTGHGQAMLRSIAARDVRMATDKA